MRINTLLSTTGCGLIAMAGICGAGAARATPITGILNTTGTAQISLGKIAFVNNMMTINSPAIAQQGGFQALAGTTASIKNIVNPPDAVGPVNEPLFIQFTAAPNISFYFQFLFPGTDGVAGCSSTPPAAGQRCTPNFPDPSPYNLENTSATSSTASFRIAGIEVDTLSSLTVPFIGTFTTPFTTQSFQDILAIVNGGGTVTTSFAAQFAVTPVPEPGTVSESVIGLGLVAFGILSSRLRKTKA